MAKSEHGRPGISIVKLVIKKSAIPFLVIGYGALFASWAFGHFRALVIPSLLGFFVITFIAYKIYKKDEKSAFKGIDGEKEVANVLWSLSDDYYVFHDVVLGKNGNIDHVVVSKNGIFTIETKAFSGRVIFNGKDLMINGKARTRYLSQSYAEAMQLRDHLKRCCGKKFFVKPFLVFTFAFVDIYGEARGVKVVNIKYLKKVLTMKRNKTIAEEEVEDIVNGLKHSYKG